MNMTKQNFLIGLILLPLLFSCSTIDNVPSDKKADATVKFSFTTAQMKGKTETKAIDASTVIENRIDNIWVLQFQNGSLAKKVYYFYGSISPTSLDVSLVSGASNIYFVANIGQASLDSFNSSESVFQTTAKSLGVESDVLFTSASGQKYIPMVGSLTGYTVPSTGDMTGQTINLIRMLARIDVNYTANLSNFELRAIRVCNLPNSVQYCVPQATLFPLSPSYSTINTDYSSASTSGLLTFYVPENMRGTGSNAGNDPRNKSGMDYATYIEFVGYTKSTDTAGDEVRYRIYPGADNYNDYNVRRNTYYTVNANIKGISSSDSRLKITPRANCYMLKPGTSVYIPVKRANESDLGIQLSDITTGWTPNIEWQTSTDLVNVAATTSDRTCGIFKVTAGTTPGNALVSIKNSSGQILWSWHIWVTDYDPNMTNVPFYDHLWMDRNLGAMSNLTKSEDDYSAFGLYYQWGRKDPFLNTGSVAVGTNATTTNLENSIRNPAVWYSCPTTHNWYADNNNSDDSYATLWGKSKTIYDPCPAGWKVFGDDSGWGALIQCHPEESNFGLSFIIGSMPFYYPLPDYRDGEAGVVSKNSHGYYWTSTHEPFGIMRMEMSNIYPTSAGRNDDGCSVRCITE